MVLCSCNVHNSRLRIPLGQPATPSFPNWQRRDWPAASASSFCAVQAELAAREASIGAGEAEVGVLRAVEAAVGLAGIQSFVLEGALAELEARTAALLDTLSGGTLALHLAATRLGKTTKREQVSLTQLLWQHSLRTTAVAAQCWTCQALLAHCEGPSLKLPLCFGYAFVQLCQGGSSGHPQMRFQVATRRYRVRPRLTRSPSSPLPVSRAGAQEKIDKVVRVQLGDGRVVDRSVRQLSGGERQRVAVALQLAFADFAAERSGVHSDLVVLDEAFQVSRYTQATAAGNGWTRPTKLSTS